MDINKENNIAEETIDETAVSEETQVETAEVIAETTEEIVSETAEEAASEITEEATAEDAEVQDSTSTLLVDTDDIDEELRRYGISSEEDSDDLSDEENVEPEKKRLIQKPIVIAAISFLLTAVLVFGVYFVYNWFFTTSVEGVWTPVGSDTPTVYLVFDDGEVSMNYGGIRSYGYYETETVNGYDMLKTKFYELAQIGENIVITHSKDTGYMNLHFLYEGTDVNTFDNTTDLSTVSMYTVELQKAEMPDLTIDPAVITHASADELGITSVNVDENVVGSWSLALDYVDDKYQTYTFNSDGTGRFSIDYYEMNGVGMGRDIDFKYTAYEEDLLITIPDVSGGSTDDIIPYSLDNGKLILFGTAFEKVN